MEQKIKTLYEALLTIETKGANTLTMANCIRYTEQLMAEATQYMPKPAESPVEPVEAEVVE